MRASTSTSSPSRPTPTSLRTARPADRGGPRRARLRGDRVDDRRPASSTTRSSRRAGRWRSPTPRRSRAWRRLPARPTRSTRGCWRCLSQRDLVPAIWLPDPRVREERELARFRLHLVKHRSALKNRIHSTLINFGRPCPVTDLFGVEGRKLLGAPRRPRALAGKRRRLARADRRPRRPDRRTSTDALRAGHADHPYVPLLLSAPGIGWVLGLHDRRRDRRDRALRHRPRSSPATPGFARASSSRASPIAAGRSQSTGPATCAGRCSRRPCTRSHPAYSERYQRTKRRLGKQRGAKVAQIDIARRLCHAIWHMLTRNENFAPRGAAFRLAA